MHKMKGDKPALLVVDMLKGSFKKDKNLAITPLAIQIIEPINALIRIFREEGCPIVFPSDAFHEDSFLFSGGIKPHSLAGTEDAEVVDELDRRQEDLFLPKPSMSAFFKTDLDQWLREREVTLCAVAGLTSNFCVLATVMDALSYNFKSVLLENCTTSFSQEVHEKTLSIYRRNALYPLFRVCSSEELIRDLKTEMV